MNRHYAMIVAAACALPAAADAGEIFGTITGDKGPVGAGTQVEAACKSGKYGPVKTDGTGKYRMVISETGKCTLTITSEGKSATLDVVSFDDAAQVDVVLKADAAGNLAARRR